MAFVDGEPIDASKLGSLETKLSELEAKIPQIGVSTNTINLSNNTGATPTVSIPQILAKKRAVSKKLELGQSNNITVPFPGKGFSKEPVVMVTLEQSADNAVGSKWTPAPIVTRVSSASFDVSIPLPSSGVKAHTVGISYIAIAY